MKYHIKLGLKRTTVSLDKMLSDILSLKLGTVPESREAHATVREWLQAHLDRNGDIRQVRVSQWLHGKAIEEIASPDLREQYIDWFIRD